MGKIILTIGIPGSGKSTWAAEYQEQNPGTLVANRDSLRESLGIAKIFDKEAESLVIKLEDEIIEFGLKTGRTVIVADTNLNLKTIKHFKEVAGGEVELKLFDVDLDECLRRNAARDRVVPEEVIRRMHKQFEEIKEELTK